MPLCASPLTCRFAVIGCKQGGTVRADKRAKAVRPVRVAALHYCCVILFCIYVILFFIDVLRTGGNYEQSWGGGRQNGPYYYDQQGMLYGSFNHLDGGYGNVGYPQMVGSPNMQMFNPYMFPMMMQS